MAVIAVTAFLVSGCGASEEKEAACEAWDDLKVALAEADFGSLPAGEDWPEGAASPVLQAIGDVRKSFVDAALADEGWNGTYKAALEASLAGFTVAEVVNSPDGRLVQASCDRLD